MDPELLQLFMSAKGNNKNVSGLLGNLDSSMLAYLAGVYDPIAAGAGNAGGPLWSQYANSQEPIIQDLVGKIQGGMDEFALNSYIDALGDVSQTGFQVGDLKGLAKALQKEYTGTASGSGGSGGKQDMWSKAGLRNPLDVYSTEDVPMGETSRADVQKIQTGRQGAQKSLSDATVKAGSARRGVVSDSAFKDELARGLTGTTSGGARRQAAALAEWLKGQDYLDETSLRNKAAELMPKQEFEAIPFERAVDFASKKVKKTPADSKKLAQYKKAKEVEGLAQQQVNAGAEEERAYREGMLGAYNAAGKTPTRDQLAGIMKFLSGQK